MVINAPISGSNGLTKGSGGNLTLTNHSNEFGTLTIDAGNVIIDDESEIGQTGDNLVLNGGFVKPAAALTSLNSNRQVITASTGGFNIGTGQTLRSTAASTALAVWKNKAPGL